MTTVTGIVGGHLDPTVQDGLPGLGGQGRAWNQAAALRRCRPTDHEGARRADAAEDEVASLEIRHRAQRSSELTQVCILLAFFDDSSFPAYKAIPEFGKMQ
jgi:hypothetical protein